MGFLVRQCTAMSLQGPVVVIGDEACDLVDELARAGAFPVVETDWEGADAAIAEIAPASIIVTSRPPHPRAALLGQQRTSDPFIPVIQQVRDNAPIPGAIPIDADAPVERRVARLSAALRVRTLHTVALRRARMLYEESGTTLII